MLGRHTASHYKDTLQKYIFGMKTQGFNNNNKKKWKLTKDILSYNSELSKDNRNFYFFFNDKSISIISFSGLVFGPSHSVFTQSTQVLSAVGLGEGNPQHFGQTEQGQTEQGDF